MVIRQPHRAATQCGIMAEFALMGKATKGGKVGENCRAGQHTKNAPVRMPLPGRWKSLRMPC